MTPKQEILFNRWGTFYKDLYYGRRKPTTREQKQFIKHVKMGLGTNAHERAFLAWLNPPKKKREKKKKHTGKVPAPRPPRAPNKPESISWITKKPIPPPPLPEPVAKEKKSDKPNYDALASGKAHGDKKRRMRERQLDRWGRHTDR